MQVESMHLACHPCASSPPSPSSPPGPAQPISHPTTTLSNEAEPVLNVDRRRRKDGEKAEIGRASSEVVVETEAVMGVGWF